MTTPRRLLVFTGDGKGKTTAAMGMALRSLGHGHRVSIFQFLKNDSTTGEIASCSNFAGIEIVQVGLGFVPSPHHPLYHRHKEAAETGLLRATLALKNPNLHLVILDEICGAVSLGLLELEKVITAIEQSHPQLCLVLTGRNASPQLIEMADTVTEMTCIKHAMEQKRAAEKGVEW